MSKESLLKRKVGRSFYRFLFLSFLSFSVLWYFFSGDQAYAGQASLSWEAPSTNEDGTPVIDLNGYKIYYGTAPGNYTQNMDVGNVTTYTFTNLTDGQTYYFVATAYNAARFESGYSNEVSKIIQSSTQTYTLSVNKAGTGIVSSTPAGISCGSDCTEVYSAGTVLTLTAAPDASSIFTGWSGACGGTGACSVTMNAAKSVNATFAQKTYAVTASAGTGGSISPVGTVYVNHGSSQSFTITANAGYNIANVIVDGASVGTVASYTFSTVTATHTISASFAPNGNTNNAATDLPKSGQTLIYASGDDGYFQAGTEWQTPRFTDNGDGTVTDTLTGLMWLKDGGCLYKSWSTALSTITDFSGNPAKYNCAEYIGSYSDWRLPNMREIESLINFGVSNSSGWLNSNGFKNVKPYYWVSTSYAASTSYAWMVNLLNGTTAYNSKKNSYYMLPVRSSTSEKSYNVPQTGQSRSYAIGDDGFIQAGIEWPTPRFTDNGDGTVTDTLTGLMWLKDGGCFRKNWSSALATITDFNNNPGKYPCREYASDYSDWRLPNIREIESLVNYGTSNSAGWINLNGFTNLNSSSYWSSTTYSGSTSQARVVDMKAGTSKNSGKNSTLYVLPVR
jgi:hypothetical protein